MNRRFNRELEAAFLQETPDTATVRCDGSGYATREASDTCDTANEWTRRRHGLHATCICVLTVGVEVCGQCATRQVGHYPKRHSVLCSGRRLSHPSFTATSIPWPVIHRCCTFAWIHLERTCRRQFAPVYVTPVKSPPLAKFRVTSLFSNS